MLRSIFAVLAGNVYRVPTGLEKPTGHHSFKRKRLQ